MAARNEPKRITFVLGLFNGDHDRDLSHDTLRVLLQALFLTDCLYLRDHPDTPDLYDSGVRYQDEPPGAEDWNDISTVLRLGFSDCEDLACWRAAELKMKHGVDAHPDFSYQVKQASDGSALYLYHIFVRLPDGSAEDPSRILGMR